MKKTLLIWLVVLISASFSMISADELDDLSGLDDATESTESSERDDLSGLGDDDSQDEQGDDLSDLGDDDALEDESDALSDSEDKALTDTSDEDEEEMDEEPAKSLNTGGYIKPLLYWQKAEYSDDLWLMYQGLEAKGYDAPNEQKEEGFTDSGVRLQFTLEGDLGEQGRFFSAFNLNYNEEADDEDKVTDIRLIEAYVELFENSRTWKIGNQLATWGFMEGIEVPTDRLNARDYSYNGMEFEDSKLASTGILIKQSLGDFSFLEYMYIPRAKTNGNADYINYFFTEEDERPASYHSNSKQAARLFLNVGDLDIAVSYTDGLDTLADVNVNASGDFQRSYHRVRSPGLDLQYNFGSFLAKLAYVQYLTEDEDGDNPFIKNYWSKGLVGVEFNVASITTNLYVGQTTIENHLEDTVLDILTNALMGQSEKNTRFVSGHINSRFLTGDAFSMTLIFANYWDDDDTTIQRIINGSFTYKLSDGMEVAFSPGVVYANDSMFQTVKTELTYSF